MELPEFDTLFVLLRAIMQSTAATTANINMRPATAMAMAKVRCDTHNASSSVCKHTTRTKTELKYSSVLKMYALIFIYPLLEHCIIIAFGHIHILVHIQTGVDFDGGRLAVFVFVIVVSLSFRSFAAARRRLKSNNNIGKVNSTALKNRSAKSIRFAHKMHYGNNVAALTIWHSGSCRAHKCTLHW